LLTSFSRGAVFHEARAVKQLFLSIALIIAGCAGTFVGGALFLIGIFRKRRHSRRLGFILIAVSLFMVASCFIFGSAKLLNKMTKANGRQIWHSIVNAVFDDTNVRPRDPTEAKRILSGKLGNTTFLDGIDVQGVWVDGVFLSYGSFVYVTDEDELLSAIAKAPVDPSFHLASDDACREVTWDECKARLIYAKGPQGNLAGWNPEAVVEKRCYICFRCPWEHAILIDRTTGKVYHSISEIRE
jgi:hypothetical protein